MKQITFRKILIAGGNPTLLVENCPGNKKDEIITKHLGEVEQIGFVSSQSGLPRLDMMGEELSVNSIIAFASILDKKGELLSSGLIEKVTYINTRKTTRITIPMKYTKKANTVLLPGIGYTYIKSESPNMKVELAFLAKQYGLPAFGYILYKDNTLIPYVYVQKTDSLFKETACGSASIALNLLFSLERIIQPSGKPIFVKRQGNIFSISAIVTDVQYTLVYDTITTDMNVQTLKGFRDFLPLEARKRQYVISTFKKVFESFGFEPLETPTLEYEELLTGKYGEEGDKLMYRFEDLGQRRVAMRYDQTVPTARVVAQYQGQLPIPFKRYQIQNVWRADNTQKGRYREFTQCDIDTIGIDSAIADAEIIATLATAYKTLGFENIKILVNDRAVFEGLPQGAITAIDKLKKIGEDGVYDELVARGITSSREEAYNLLQSILEKKPTERLQEIFEALKQLGVDEKDYEYSPTLARGLDYYTGMIFEIEIPSYPVGSVSGGGRYDKLIGMFAGRDIPAVGVAVGFDRTLEAMEAANLFPQDILNSSTKVLVTVFSPEYENKSTELVSSLRKTGINAEIYLTDSKLDKQLKYANAKAIPYVIILGPEEAERNVVNLKNLQSGEQITLPLDEVISKLLQ